MKMTNLSMSATALAVMLASFGAQAASSGTFTAKGEVVENTCDVDVAGQGHDATIYLPIMNTASLSSAPNSNGLLGGATPFDITISNCTGAAYGNNNVYVFFESINGGTDLTTISPTAPFPEAWFENTYKGADASTNVVLKLSSVESGSMTPVVPGADFQGDTSITAPNMGSNEIVSVPVPPDSYTFKFQVEYWARGIISNADVSPGIVETEMYYTLAYE